MKKILSIVLVLVLCTSLMAMTVSAADSGSMSVSSATVAADASTVTVTVSINSNPGIMSMTLKPVYDANVLKLTSMVPGGMAIGGWQTGTQANWSASENCTSTGTILTLNFEVLQRVDTEVSVSFPFLPANYDEELVDFSISGGKVTFEKAPCTEHAWDAGVKTDATCTEAGKIVYTCTECGATKEDPIAALGHAWGEWTVTKAATCTEKGEETRTCANDATHVETREVAAVGHKWTQWVEGEDGKLHRECTVCGEPQTQNDPTVVPGGDITPMLTMGAVAVFCMLAAAAYVFGRKFAK